MTNGILKFFCGAKLRFGFDDNVHELLVSVCTSNSGKLGHWKTLQTVERQIIEIIKSKYLLDESVMILLIFIDSLFYEL